MFLEHRASHQLCRIYYILRMGTKVWKDLRGTPVGSIILARIRSHDHEVRSTSIPRWPRVTAGQVQKTSPFREGHRQETVYHRGDQRVGDVSMFLAPNVRSRLCLHDVYTHCPHEHEELDRARILDLIAVLIINDVALFQCCG